MTAVAFAVLDWEVRAVYPQIDKLQMDDYAAISAQNKLRLFCAYLQRLRLCNRARFASPARSITRVGVCVAPAGQHFANDPAVVQDRLVAQLEAKAASELVLDAICPHSMQIHIDGIAHCRLDEIVGLLKPPKLGALVNQIAEHGRIRARRHTPNDVLTESLEVHGSSSGARK